jgi:predicted DNA-binding transcriptional regulator AlpA
MGRFGLRSPELPVVPTWHNRARREALAVTDPEIRASDANSERPVYLTRREAAERCRVSVSSFDKLRRDRSVPFPDAEVGKHVLWREETIDQFLARGGTKHK